MQTSAISFTFTVTGALTITNAVGVPAAVQGQPYSYQFTTSGGTAPITFSATGLPAGLSISSGGLLSGTPSAAGSFSVTITAQDSTP